MMDTRITELIADGARLSVYRPYLDGLFVAYVHCLYIDYRGEGPTVEAAMAALAEDITLLRGEAHPSDACHACDRDCATALPGCDGVMVEGINGTINLDAIGERPV